MSAIGKTLKFTGGLILGAGIGTLTALLLAPQSGQLSREQVQGRIEEVADAARRASRHTEDELLSRWEAAMTDTEAGKSKDKDQDPSDRARKAAAEVSKREEARRKEAERHLEKANEELDKARKSI